MENTPSPYTVNRQGVSGLGRAWFYLTLWRGTPPEFTDDVTVEIQQAESAQSLIAVSDAAEAGIERTTAAAADIASKDAFSMDIIKETAVVWYVG